ncbi:MAG: BamA/TamA family outer membrane protein [Chitinophagaceae bacterium]|nr:BamA/TamA family outer membrane protein [Chitinophagaceae bacterium]
MLKCIIYQVLLWGGFTVCFSACSTTRSVPAGDALYTGASVDIEDKAATKKERKRLETELSELARPLPNKKILGIPFKLMIYNMAGNPKREKSLSGWLKYKVGEPPVLLSKVSLDYNTKVLQSTLENQGYFKSSTLADTTVKNKKASATYTVTTGVRYTIHSIELPKDSSALQRCISEASAFTLLKKGNPFDLAVIKAERERVDAYLKEKGFYYFDPDYLIVEADSTAGDNKVDLFMKIKPGVPGRAKEVYTINDVYIFPGYRLNVNVADTLKKNAEFFEGYYLVDRRNTYKPAMFRQAMQFLPGNVYNRKAHSQSISRLVNLGVFKFVKNRFEPVEVNDSAKLNTYYYLTSLPKKSLRADINANTKSNNLTGSAITIGWRNRNIFKGGELLSIDATAGFEIQFSGQLKGYNTYRGGLETQLSFPRFIVPFFSVNTRGGFMPKTNLTLAYDMLSKERLYLMNSFRTNFGYAWKETIKKEHLLNPIAINYVQPLRVTQEYKDSVATNATLAKAIEKQFIIGSNYNYNYNELSVGNAVKGFYFNGNLDLSGNIAGLITGANTRQGEAKTILGAQFSQYVKVETDFRYYIRLSSKNTWANRLIIGLGYPYGNSHELPFIKQFFAGGTNSIRAFRSRALGPGTYKDPAGTSFLPDQSGDIKLELNSELRAKLFSIVYGAVFVDAGNIWLYNDSPDKPGARFSNRFLKELAVGTGLGLRFDISFLVLRLDVAFPVRKPWLQEAQRWVIDDIQFGNKAWRKDNLVYNIGIGYPF